MLKKTMTYTDFNNEEVTEDFYFAYNKAELIELELRAGEGGFSAMVTKIIAEDDRNEILNQFRKLILDTVGRRSEDGRRFIKNAQIREEFEQTPAFSDMLVEFYTEPDSAAKFIAGVIPGDMKETVDKAIAEGALNIDSTGKPPAVLQAKTWRDYTRQQLVELPEAEFSKLVEGMKPLDMDRELLAVAMQRRQENPQ